MGGRFRLLLNTRHDPAAPYAGAARALFDEDGFRAARAEITAWPEYRPTPLLRSAAIAARCGVRDVRLKDETGRFDLGSFKAIGGAYGALHALQADLAARGAGALTAAELRAGDGRAEARDVVLACATDGNHGRAVAWAARAFGCRCEVYIPRIVSGPRRDAIAALGARVTRIDGTYDDALRALDEAARERGWLVVSDQAYPGYEAIPRDIMRGYMLVAEEALQQWGDEERPTHVFVQAGVGGFAAAICARLWQRCGGTRPLFVCVEPLAADCVYRSAAAGHPETVPGDLETVMGCLSCGEPSPLAWPVLQDGAAAFLAIDDDAAVEAMRLLAFSGNEPGLAVGESGAAGLAGLLRVAGDRQARRDLQLDADARVLLFATEGASDPAAYAALVGVDPSEVTASGRDTRG